MPVALARTAQVTDIADYFPVPRKAMGALPGAVGDSAAMRRLAELVARVAPLDVPALIRGESGTGKELVARGIHQCSKRAQGPLVAVNGATLSGQLAASALFGHERGAFTGASTERVGAFRRAHGGTLFLDEVSALSPESQAALLRVVEEGSVLAVGSDTPVTVDVRLVAATCEPIERMVECGRFRRDLYQRLSTCILWVPPLRQRPCDVPALAQHLLAEIGLGATEVDVDALRVLLRCRLPGNVRELRNLLTQAALCCNGAVVTRAALELALEQRRGIAAPPVTAEDAEQLLRSCGGNVSEAARVAGLARSTFRDLLRRSR